MATTAAAAQHTCTDVQTYHAQILGCLSTWPSVQITVVVAYSMLVLTSVASNALVFAVITVVRSLRTVRNYFIAVLALSDIFLVTTSGIITPLTVLQKQWHLGSFMCHFVAAVQV